MPGTTCRSPRRSSSDALTGCKLIFDIRGLMAEEYADAGRWNAGGLPIG